MAPLVERREVGGIPAFCATEAVGSAVAGLTFRVGRVDERASNAGISHLVEHLALPGRTGQAVDYNGTVEPFVTSFYASGEPAAVREFMASTTELLARLPLERLEIERRILQAEDATRSGGGARLALKLRFGAVGAGLVGYDDYGLRRLEADEVLAWSAANFTSGNAALWAIGLDAGELDLALPEGGRRPLPPEPRPLADLTTPALYAAGWDTGFCLSFLSRRSAATTLALDVLGDALRDRLRYELGLSYGIDTSSQPLSADLTHLVITGDVVDEKASEWLAGALDVLGGLGAECDEARVETAKAAHRRYEAEPSSVTGHAAWCADQELIGAPFESRSELAAEREALTTADVSRAISAFAPSLLVLGPELTYGFDDLAEYPYTSSTRVDGRSVRPAGIRSRLRRGGSRLVIAPEGVSLVHPEGNVITARYAETVLCIRSLTARTLLTEDGFYATVDSEEWADGKRLVAEIDAALPDDIVVWDTPERDERVTAVQELAHATFKRTWLVSEELEALPALLDEDEALLALGAGSRGWRYGLIAVTDRRFRFLYGDGSKHSFTVDRAGLHSKADGSKLEVFVDDEWVALTDVGPKGKAAELALAIHTGERPAT
jgi:predicted Zn-dependent peptidase